MDPPLTSFEPSAPLPPSPSRLKPTAIHGYPVRESWTLGALEPLSKSVYASLRECWGNSCLASRAGSPGGIDPALGPDPVDRMAAGNAARPSPFQLRRPRVSNIAGLCSKVSASAC